jgi:hypothetical protein
VNIPGRQESSTSGFDDSLSDVVASVKRPDGKTIAEATHNSKTHLF